MGHPNLFPRSISASQWNRSKDANGDPSDKHRHKALGVVLNTSQECVIPLLPYVLSRDEQKQMLCSKDSTGPGALMCQIHRKSDSRNHYAELVNKTCQSLKTQKIRLTEHETSVHNTYRSHAT